MPFHLAAYTTLLGTVANTDIPAVSDDILTIVNNHFQLRKPMSLIAAYAASATLSRARLDSPTIRFFGQPYIRPMVVGTLPPTNANKQPLYVKPLVLPPGEEIAMQATSGIAMGTERFTGLIWLAGDTLAVAAGNAYPVRFTSTGTAVVNTWTTISYTLETGLPSQAFMMLLSEVQSTNSLAHRWIFDEQQERPGFLGMTSLGNRLPDDDYLYRYGAMGRFVNTSLPRLQVLCNVADTAHEGYMWVVPVGGLLRNPAA